MDENTVWQEYTPQSIYKYLDAHIVGQTELKKAVAMIIYNAIHWRRSTNFIVGKTGTGKTEVFRVAKDLFNGLICIIDSNCLGAPGFKNSVSVAETLHARMIRGNEPVIVVYDEFDKKLKPEVGGNNTDYNAIVQDNMLTLADGDSIMGGDSSKTHYSISGKYITLVMTGACSSIYARKERAQNKNPLGFTATTEKPEKVKITIEDLINYGMNRELAGRITRLITTEDNSKTSMFEIGKRVRDKLAWEYKCPIKITDKALRVITNEALESGLGARYIRNQLLQKMDDVLFENPETDVIHI